MTPNQIYAGLLVAMNKFHKDGENVASDIDMLAVECHRIYSANPKPGAFSRQMILNRGYQPTSVDFFKHMHAVQDFCKAYATDYKDSDLATSRRFGMTEDDYVRTYNHILVVVSNRMGIDATRSERELQAAIESKDPMAYQLAEHYRNAYREWWTASKAVADCTDDSKITDLRMVLMGKIRERDNYRKSIESYLAANHRPVARMIHP